MPENQETTENKEVLEKAKELTDEINKIGPLDALRDSEGGKVLVAGLVQDIIGALEAISTGTHTLTHNEFITLGCRIKERLDIVRVLNGAKTNHKFLQEELRTELEKIQQ